MDCTYINNLFLVTDKCNVCFGKLNLSSTNEIQIFSNTNTLFKFCSNECLNKSIVSKKRMVSCHLCKVSFIYLIFILKLILNNDKLNIIELGYRKNFS